MELIYTFKSHRGPMLFMVMSSNREHCYSGATDRIIQGWNTTNPGHLYDSFSPSCYSDAVWGLAYSACSPTQRIACSSSGAPVRWSQHSACWVKNQELAILTSVVLVSSDPSTWSQPLAKAT